MRPAKPPDDAFQRGLAEPQTQSIFTHYFDIHFLEEKGVSGFREQALKEMRLATRLAVMAAEKVFVPAASFHESRLCRETLEEFDPEVFSGILRLVASGANQGEFFEEKLRQYPERSEQGRIYRAAGDKLLFPWAERFRSATKDIGADWSADLQSGEAERLFGGFHPYLVLAHDLPRRWEETPHRLEGRAFVVENVAPILFGTKDLPLQVKNRLRRPLNKSYYTSYALDLDASVVQDLNWLSSPEPVPSGLPEGDLRYRPLVEACRAEGILEEIARGEGQHLLQLKSDERFAAALAISAGSRQDDTRATYYNRTPRSLPSSKRVRMAERTKAIKILIVTALPKEATAMKIMLDKHERFGLSTDPNLYNLGVIYLDGDPARPREIILASSGMGKVHASTLATSAIQSFPGIDHIIMTGIAGGCPDHEDVERHVRLGDIVYSDESGIIEYDFVKETEDERQKRRFPEKPSARLLKVAHDLVSEERLGVRPWVDYLQRVRGRHGFDRPSGDKDVLHHGEDIVPHPHDPLRRDGHPRIYGGGIGTADTLLKNAATRDELRDKYKVRAVEMEASGIQSAAWAQGKDVFVVRGICDYCDTHKNDDWQEYAAAAAAAYTRALVEALPAAWFPDA